MNLGEKLRALRKAKTLSDSHNRNKILTSGDFATQA